MWSGDGEGPGNAALVSLGATSVTDVHDVFKVTERAAEPKVQDSLF
jgi:hypothetical protein